MTPASRLGLSALVVAAACAHGFEPQRQSSAAGEWWTPGFNARVRLEACGDALCGRIAWLWDESPRDIADKAQLVGRVVVEGMRPESAVRWSGGTLYNPEDGRSYRGSIELQSPDRLLVSGCVLFMCTTQVWRRFDRDKCPPVAGR